MCDHRHPHSLPLAVAIYCAVIILLACINFFTHNCNYEHGWHSRIYLLFFINWKTISFLSSWNVRFWNWTNRLFCWCLHAKLNDWIACALNTCRCTILPDTLLPRLLEIACPIAITFVHNSHLSRFNYSGKYLHSDALNTKGSAPGSGGRRRNVCLRAIRRIYDEVL